jgi:nickel-dependent lactate racemase
MRIAIPYGRQSLNVEIGNDRLIDVQRASHSPPLADLRAAVEHALESPLGFPALRRALTPDDHVVVIVDEQLARLAELLTPILEHVCQARVAPEAITLLCPATSTTQPWVDDLPDAFQDVRLEVHDPSDRRHLSYLATTRHGRRIYLNRTAVDADQLIVLTRRGYDPLLGYSGAEGAIYPALSDEATLQESGEKLTMMPPGKTAWPICQEATEVAWLLGAPFLVQVIEGCDTEVLHVLGGLVETSSEGQRLLDASWRIEVERPADTVIAAVGGDPARQTFADLAQALACASRVAKSGGYIVLLTEANPVLGPEAAVLQQADDPAQALNRLRQQKLPNPAVAFQWASAARQATIYVLSRLPAETVESLFAVPLDHAGQTQRLVANGSCIIIPAAHKSMAAIGPNDRNAPLTS